ncbi:MAG TPA: hypothetical protein DCP61_00195 [Treponema sp.]|nr:hypothetical protein [Treponema sp.]
MYKKKGFSEQTHFIGIPVSIELEELVEECREYMSSVYGCHSGYGTPPHITLIPPFALADGFDGGDLLDAVYSAADECKALNLLPLQVDVCGFGSFSERTLFANVQDSDGWQKLYSVFCKKISSAIPAAVKKGGRRLCPHLTIANRDIPSGAMDQALKHFAQLNLNESFTADSIAIYTRNSGGGWKEWQRSDC